MVFLSMTHGAPQDEVCHEGDLGNIVGNANGNYNFNNFLNHSWHPLPDLFVSLCIIPGLQRQQLQMARYCLHKGLCVCIQQYLFRTWLLPWPLLLILLAGVQIPLTGPNAVVGRAIVIHELEDDLGKGNNSCLLIRTSISILGLTFH